MIKKDPKAFPKLLLLGFRSRAGAGSALKHEITPRCERFSSFSRQTVLGCNYRCGVKIMCIIISVFEVCAFSRRVATYPSDSQWELVNIIPIIQSK